jgi:hypothetical protein
MPKDDKEQPIADVIDRAKETFWYYENGERFETFKSEEAGHAWLEKNDPEGALWEARRGPRIPAGTADENDVPMATE